MRSLLILLASVVVCFGQYMPMADPAFVARANYEVLSIADTNNYNLITNITGYPVWTWWPVNGNVGTNSGVLTLTNLASWTDTATVGDLTNKIAGSFPIYTSSVLNGYAGLVFDGTDDYLRAMGITATASGCAYEGFLVLAYTNAGTAVDTLFAMRTAAGHTIRDNNRKFEYVGSATITDGYASNKWMVVNFVYSSDLNQSTLYTNGVSAGTSTASATQVTRFTLGAHPDLSTSFANMAYVDGAMWKTNLGAAADAAGTPYSVGIRSNVFFCFTNKYAISLNSGP